MSGLAHVNSEICQCHACTQARRSGIERALDSQRPPEMTSLRDIRQKLEALVEMRADDERWRKLCLEKLEAFSGQIKGLGDGLADELARIHARLVEIGLDVGLHWRKPRGRRK
jgi:hypothetical protein